MDHSFFFASNRRSLSQLAARYQLDVVRDASFSNLGFLRTQERDLLVVLYSAKFVGQLKEELSRVAAVLTTEEMVQELEGALPPTCGLASCKEPQATFYAIHVDLVSDGFYSHRRASHIDRSARIHPTAVIADSNVWIGPDVSIGPRAVVEENTVIGANCVIRAGVVLSTEGFEVREVRGSRIVVPHAGGVVLGRDVEIQANSCVSRTIWGGSTRIGAMTKLDNMVHVAHGAAIGERCRLASCASIAGTTTIGDDVWIGPNATVSAGLYLGDKAWIALGSAVVKDVPAGTKVGGVFARAMP